MYFRGAGQTLTANVLRPVTAEEVARVSLRDDGISPDQTANDSIYSGNVVFSIQRANAGRYRVQFIATTSEGMISNILEKPLKLSRRNSIPRLSDLNAPDTLQRPTTGSLLFSMSIAAADSDGLQDVQEVVFQNLNSISQQRLPLLDDGGVRQPNGITSGDVAAGDGIYSTIVQLPDTVSPRTFLFKFQARDLFGDTSAAILHNFTVR
jgi:hypothetical protein